MAEDIYEDWKGIKDYMDFSGYDKNHPCFDATNKKVLGKFKDEMDGKIVTNFIALRPIMYCLKVFNEKKPEKKAKGVPKLKVQKGFRYERLRSNTPRTHTKECQFQCHQK